jgi:hypothetical protein
MTKRSNLWVSDVVNLFQIPAEQIAREGGCKRPKASEASEAMVLAV